MRNTIKAGNFGYIIIIVNSSSELQCSGTSGIVANYDYFKLPHDNYDHSTVIS